MGRKKNGKMRERNKEGPEKRVVIAEGVVPGEKRIAYFYNMRYRVAFLRDRCGFVKGFIYINKLNANHF